MIVCRWALLAGAMLCGSTVRAETPAETAAAFGARPAVQQLSLSPDGTHIAFVAPTGGVGTTLYTVALGGDATPRPALQVSGKPERLTGCGWVSNDRLACTVYGVVQGPGDVMPFSRLFAVDAQGGHQTQLTTRASSDQIGSTLYGGGIIDWLPGQDGSVLMQRVTMPRVSVDSLVVASTDRTGLGVDRVDTRSLAHVAVEPPRGDASEYITDGLGHVRIAGFMPMRGATGQAGSTVTYRFRSKGGGDWQPLGTYDTAAESGFNPFAVDTKQDVAIGLEKLDGRLALVAKALDGTGRETTLFRRADVDVGGVVRIGRQQRVIGATYTTDTTHVVYFDPEMKALDEALHRALPRYPIVSILDASADENVLLILAGADNEPGRYYLFDRTTKTLQVVMQVRPQLDGRTLATMQAVRFPAADGTMIPAYLTLPTNGQTRGLHAIVLPHGGPSARDEWGFDWLSQYYAARGYAVLQPQYRGSSGYGDAWFRNQGFKQWRVAIGDVDDAGRWLVKEGIADPAKLAIVGWSYGGYAALQSAVLDPGLYKAVVAIAPVTDLATLKEERRRWTNYRNAADFIGMGPHVVEGSPAQNAARIKVPVMLVHGTIDRNVGYGESLLMQLRLQSAGGSVQLLGFPGLDHQLDDSTARAQMLERSDVFIRTAVGG